MKKQEGSLLLFSCFIINFSTVFVQFFTGDFRFFLRQKALSGKASTVDGVKRGRARERGRAVPAPEANAEIQTNLDVSQTRSRRV